MEIDQEATKNQQALREIISTLGITQAQAAALITKETLRKVSTRTVRTWLAPPTAITAQHCPEWPVKVLKKIVEANKIGIDPESLKNQQDLREIINTLGITQSQAAALITKETLRKVSTRTVRTWLAPPDAITAQPCPLWAVMALKRAAVK
jgi:predicted XRE-type DNA-binding protein